MDKQKFSAWVAQEKHRIGHNDTSLQKDSGIGRDRISLGLLENKWSWRTIEKISRALGSPIQSKETFEETFEVIWLRDRTVPPKTGPTLPDILAKMEAIQTKQDVKSLLPKVFDAVSERRPAFMATMTLTKMPSLLDSSPLFDDLREAVKRGQANGLMAIFIVPNKSQLESLQKYHFTPMPSASQYVETFSKYFDNDRSRLITSDMMDMASPHYITTLIGETTDYNQFSRRVVERGPASAGNVWVVPRQSEYELDLASYITAVIRTHSLDGFGEEFVSRMGMRARLKHD